MSRNATFRGANLQYVAAPKSLTGLSDVTVASAANLDRLQYSTSAGKWVDVAALTTPQIEDSSADHQYIFAVSELAADRTITLPLLTGNDTFVFASFAATLANKTLTSAVLNTGVSGSAVLDQDDMSGNSATQLATQQSIKAYVDAQVATEDTLAELNDTTISGPASNDVLQYSGSAWVDRTYAEAGLVSLTGSETLTNKTLTAPTINGGTATALTDLDMTSGSKTIFDTIGSNTLTIGASGTTVTIPGNLTVTGSHTTVSTTNLLVTDKLITLNDGGSASSGTAVGIEVEEDSAVTGYFKTAADRAGWELKAPGTAGVLSIDPSANSNTLAFGGSGKTLTISETATIDQDLATTANVTHANLTATGNVSLGNAASDTVTITGTILGASPLVFEGGTANGYETTLAITDPTADRTWTLPSATDTFVGLATADTLSNKTLASPVITTGDINTPDIDGGTVDAITSLTIANNVDVGSYTVRASGFLADGLTSGQVVYTGTNGVLSSEAALAYNASTNILTAGEVSMTTLDIGGTNVTSTAAELNILDGVTSTAAELNILDGVTSTAAELNIVDGVTSTAAELNLVDGSSANTVVNSKAVIYGSSGELAGTLSTVAQGSVTSLGTLTALTGGTGDLIWDTDTLVVDSSTDRVGIGTTTPVSPLHVRTGTTSYSGSWSTYQLVLEGDASTYIQFLSTGSTQLRFGDVADTNQMGFVVTHTGNANSLAWHIGGDTKFLIDGTGTVYIGDTENDQMTTGLTVKQAAGVNDQAIALKSVDVGHAMTNFVEADTYLRIQKAQGSSGGVLFEGFKDAGGDAGLALNFSGTLGEAADTSDTTSSTAVIRFMARVTDGSDSAEALAAGGNLFAITDAGTVRLLVKGNGDLHATNITSGGGDMDAVALDREDDVGLIRAFERHQHDDVGVLMTRWDEAVKANEEDLRRVGVLTGDFYSLQRMDSLLGGGIWQLHIQLAQAQERLAETERKLMALEAA